MSEIPKVMKWNQGKPESYFPSHKRDIPKPRLLVVRDAIIYSICYLFPPSAKFFNKFADYPLRFISPTWTVGLSALWFVTLLPILIPLFSSGRSSLTPLERYGPFLCNLFRSVVVALVEGMNFPNREKKAESFLSDYAIKVVNVDSPLTAHDLYQYIMGQSHFDPHLTAKNLLKHKFLTLTGALVSFSVALISPVLRVYSGGKFFGNSFPEFLASVTGILLLGGLMFLLMANYFVGFSFYRSMSSSMRRLRNTIVRGDNIPAGSEKGSMFLDATYTQNLCALIQVHKVLFQRKKSPIGRIITLGASMNLLFLLGYFIMMLTESKSSAHDSTYYIATYFALISALCLGALSWVGDRFNFVAKRTVQRKLYAIEMEIIVDIHSNPILSSEEKKRLDSARSLLKRIQKHCEHTPDLGLMGISYSKIYWALVGIISSYVPRIITSYLSE